MKPKVLLKSHLFLSSELLNEEIIETLTFKNMELKKHKQLGVDTEGLDEYIHLYKYIDKGDKSFIRVPRYTLGSMQQLGKRFNVRHNFPKEHFINIQWLPKDKNFELNNSQMATIDNTELTLKKDYGAIIVAPPGEGKTTMAINIICRFKQKALVLVHKDSLIKQWKDEILHLTNLSEDRIGLLQQGKFIDGDIVIGSQMSLMRSTINREINNLFPIVIQDEVHRIGARMFLRAFTRFNARYRLGLSATPNRDDEQERLYFLHLSNNLIKHTPVRNVKSKYVKIEFETKTKWKKQRPYIPFRLQLTNNLIEDNNRNILLKNIIDKCLHDNRKIVVMGERIKHLKELMKHTQSNFKDKNIVRFFGAETLTKKQKKAGEKPEKYQDPEQNILNSADIIFATYGKLSDGNNIPHIDTLLYATPKSSNVMIEQTKGRIEREYKNKQPVIIDIVDMRSKLLRNMFGKRERLYKSLGMEEEKNIQFS